MWRLGKYKDAVRYFSRALKYLTRLQPDFSDRHMELSVMLGQALLGNAPCGAPVDNAVDIFWIIVFLSWKYLVPHAYDVESSRLFFEQPVNLFGSVVVFVLYRFL